MRLNKVTTPTVPQHQSTHYVGVGMADMFMEPV